VRWTLRQSVLGAWSGRTRPEIGQAPSPPSPPAHCRRPGRHRPNRFAGQAQSAAYRGAHTDLVVQTALGAFTASVAAQRARRR